MKSSARVTSYKDLIVYQKARILTIDLIKYFSRHKFPKAKEFLINQLFRSISSIGANLAEGFGRNYSGSFRQFVGIARGSCFESDYWLEVILECEDFDSKVINGFIERNVELAKMLTGLMRKTKGNRS
jgi:four helix bundle protein